MSEMRGKFTVQVYVGHIAEDLSCTILKNCNLLFMLSIPINLVVFLSLLLLLFNILHFFSISDGFVICN